MQIKVNRKTEEKKVLYFLYYFPPAGTVGSLRNYEISKELSSYFTSSHLITVKTRPFEMEEQFACGYMEMHEIEHFDYRSIGKNKQYNNRLNARGSRFKFGMIRKLLDSYPGNLLWGEGGWIYIRNAVKMAIELIEKEKITHIYSSFRPMADHYIAKRIKERFPELIWIADFRDLPVDPYMKNVFFPDFQKRRYKRLFKKADILTTVSEGLMKNLQEINPNTIVTRNGIRKMFIPDDIQKPDKFTISYLGSLYPGYRDPEPFFKALKSLIDLGKIDPDQLRLLYAGKDFRIWEKYMHEYDFEDICECFPRLALSKSIRLQHESHINLLLTWSDPHSKGILTGKLVEYLGAGNPILCLVKGEKDAELERIFRESNAGKIFYNNDQNIERWLFDLYSYRLKQDEKHKMNEKVLNKMGWESSLQKLRIFLQGQDKAIHS